MHAKTAVLFPGQGSQKLGMFADEIQYLPELKAAFCEASDILSVDLWSICQHDEARLNETRYTQPILLAAGVGLWRTLRQKQMVSPAFMAGHSLGEYAALVCANALSFADGVKLVARRGELMQQAVPDNAGAMMAVIGLSDEAALEACQQLNTAVGQQVMMPANYNCPGQVVVAGLRAYIEAFEVQAKQLGAKKVLPLAMSVPSHCWLMAAAAQEFAHELASSRWAMPEIPVLQNATLACPTTVTGLQQALASQLTSAVNWTQTMQYFAKQQIISFIECGPGMVLSGLNRRIVSEAATTPVTKLLMEAVGATS